MHEREPDTNEDQPSGPETERAETEPKQRPRIYAASLSDYNHGILHGDWLDAAVEPREMLEGIAGLLARSPTATKLGQPAEEWAIHDFEGFGPLRLGEYEGVAWITEVARGIAEHGSAFGAWAAHIGAERVMLQSFEDRYLGEWDCVEAYAEQFLEDVGATATIEKIDEWLQPYIDVDVKGFARDLELGGDVIAIDKPDGGVWLFSSY